MLINEIVLFYFVLQILNWLHCFAIKIFISLNFSILLKVAKLLFPFLADNTIKRFATALLEKIKTRL